jgi:hypothetical protein
MGILWLKFLAAWLNIFVAAYSLQGFVAAYGGLRRRLRGLLGGLGERLSCPSGSGRSPAAKRVLVQFWLKMKPPWNTELL